MIFIFSVERLDSTSMVLEARNIDILSSCHLSSYCDKTSIKHSIWFPVLKLFYHYITITTLIITFNLENIE